MPARVSPPLWVAFVSLVLADVPEDSVTSPRQSLLIANDLPTFYGRTDLFAGFFFSFSRIRILVYIGRVFVDWPRFAVIQGAKGK